MDADETSLTHSISRTGISRGFHRIHVGPDDGRHGRCYLLTGRNRKACTGLRIFKPIRATMQLMEQQQENSNVVSDETGQFDPRFVLWRKFCADQGIPVDSLPIDLVGDIKEQWEKLKDGKLGSTSG